MATNGYWTWEVSYRDCDGNRFVYVSHMHFTHKSTAKTNLDENKLQVLEEIAEEGGVEVIDIEVVWNEPKPKSS